MQKLLRKLSVHHDHNHSHNHRQEAAKAPNSAPESPEPKSKMLSPEPAVEAPRSEIPAMGYAAMVAKEPLAPFSFIRRAPGPKDVEIEIKYCGVCHSDIHQVRGEWGPGGLFPMVPGHEITGVVRWVGKQVSSNLKVGDTVGVGCFVDSCRECDACKNHLESYCPKGNATYNSKDKDGRVAQGGYSNCIVVAEEYVLKVDKKLDLAAAAPLLCAGITVYSPLVHWKAGPGKRVAVVGMGGLGHLAVKIGKAMGAEITVLSQTDRKKEDGIKLGASNYYATSDPETFKTLAGAFDLILCTISADVDWNAYIGMLKLDGAMVLLGIPAQPVPVSAIPLIFGRRSLAGSLIGGIKETQEMLDFCAKHGIVSEIETIPIQDINKAYERILKSDVRYRFVIDIASLNQ